nr:MAG TPA: hypothetical protein [Caudoviricetes sp.]
MHAVLCSQILSANHNSKNFLVNKRGSVFTDTAPRFNI